MDNTKRYKAVFFDLGGTLRIALKDEPYMKQDGGDRRHRHAIRGVLPAH